LAGTTAGILVDPDILFLERLRLLLRLLLLLLRLLIALISRTLATAGAPLLFLYSGNLSRSIPMIRPFLSPLIPVIRAIELPWSPGIAGVPLGLPLSLCIKAGLHGISQSITISYLDCLGQSGRHFSLKLLPQHGAMPTPMSEPHDGLLLIDSFAGIAQRAPPGQVVTVGLICSLPAHSQLLRTVGPLVCTGEV
jgi:hypothetical protein